MLYSPDSKYLHKQIKTKTKKSIKAVLHRKRKNMNQSFFFFSFMTFTIIIFLNRF